MHETSPALRQRWRILSAAPHRLFFATGLISLLLHSGWWTAMLAARAAGIGGLEAVRPALIVHGATMLYLIFAPFMFGFLLTVFPRWMPAPQVSRGWIVAAFAFFNIGNLAVLAGLWSSPSLLATGWLMAASAFAILLGALLASLLRAANRAVHAITVVAGLAAGLLGMLLVARGLWNGDFSAWPLARGAGLWGFLLVVYFSVCHRMVPFFSSRVVPGYRSWRPDWVLYLFVALAIARAGLETVPRWGWLATIPMAALGVTCALRWRPADYRGVRLLQVLHIAIAWLALGLVLAAAADLAAFVGQAGILGRAPLHAITMGFLGGMLMAMVTRVTLGHSGRELAMDELNWRLFLAVQGAAIVRLAAEFVATAAPWLSLAAAALWLGAFLCWAARHLPIYLRPRADGAPG